MTKPSPGIQTANREDSEPIELDRSTSMSQNRPSLVDKTLSSAANLARLHPTGTVLAFQALSPSFSNHGICYTSNKCITFSLVIICTISCIFFCFTDSFKGTNGKLYYGIATFKSFIVFNYEPSDGERSKVLVNLQKLKLRPRDYVHAFFAVVVFLSLAFSDTNIQLCFSSNSGPNTKQLLQNLPLGTSFMSSMVFLIFPTARKGIGHSDMEPNSQ